MKNDEIKRANRKALPKFLLFSVACMTVGGVIGYFSGYGAATGGLYSFVGMMKEAGAFFGTHVAPWLLVALAVILPAVCIPICRRAKNWLLRGTARRKVPRTQLTEGCPSPCGSSVPSLLSPIF